MTFSFRSSAFLFALTASFLFGCLNPKTISIWDADEETPKGCISDMPRFVRADPQDVGAFAFQNRIGHALHPETKAYFAEGGGLIVADFNGDGHDDIYLPTLVQDELYFGDGFGWFEAATHWLPPLSDPSVGGAAADYDGDGDVDIYVTVLGESDRLYRNDGDSFTDVIAQSGISTAPQDSTAAVWYDVDLDGDLDLFVGVHRDDLYLDLDQDGLIDFPEPHDNAIYINDGKGFFESIPIIGEKPFTFAAAFVHFLPDERPLLYLINDFGAEYMPNMLLRFNGVAYEPFNASFSGLGVAMNGMGVVQADLNGDRYPDFWMSNYLQPKLLVSQVSGLWAESAASYGFASLMTDQKYAWGLGLADFENDGDLDAWMGWGPLPSFESFDDDNGVQPDSYYEQRDGSFHLQTESWGLTDTEFTRGGLFIDFNEDGLLDLIRASQSGPAEIFWGQISCGHWLEIELDLPILNHKGIGSRVTILSGDKEWTEWIVAGNSHVSSGPPRVHFGLGRVDSIDEIIIAEPDGREWRHGAVDLDQRVVLHRSE